MSVESEPLPEAVIYRSLYDHSEIIGAIDTNSLTYERLALGSASQAVRLRFSSRGNPRQLVMRLPQEYETNPHSVSYTNEFNIRNALPSTFPYQPKPYYVAEEPFPHIVEAYAEGFQPPVNGEQWSNTMLSSLGTTLGTLHKATAQPVDNTSPLPAVALLEGEYQRNTPRALPSSVGTPAEPYLRDLDERARQYIRQLAAHFTPGATQTLIHNDLVAQNMLHNPLTGALSLVDWEFAKPHDPALEVAKVFTENSADFRSARPKLPLNLTAAQEDTLLDAYQIAYGTDPGFVRRVHIWQQVVWLGRVVNLASAIYNTSVTPRWFHDPLTGWTFDRKAGREEFENVLTAKGYPILHEVNDRT